MSEPTPPLAPGGIVRRPTTAILERGERVVPLRVLAEVARTFRVPRRMLVHREAPERRRMHQDYRRRQLARRRRGRRS